MPYNYKIKPTDNPLTENELYFGRLVCLDDVDENPNNVGTLEDSRKIPGAIGVYTAIINGERRYFGVNGIEIPETQTSTPILYGVVYDNDSSSDLDPEESTTITRGTGKVSLVNMTPKDYFACNALNAIMSKMDNLLSLDNGTIGNIAAMCYKIAQAMANEAYNARQNNETSSTSGDYVDVDPTELQDNKERVLYNISESLKEALNKGFAIKGETVPAGGTPTPVQTKVIEVTNIKKLEEITNIKKLDEITDVKKVTEVTNIKKLDEITNIKTIDELTEVTTIGEITEVKTIDELTNIKTIDEVTDIKVIDEVTDVSGLTISGTPNVKIANTTSDPVNTKEVST